MTKEFNNSPKVDATFLNGGVGKPSTEGVLYFNTMGKRIEVKNGERYGRLVIVKEVNRKGANNSRSFLCKCDCGKEAIVTLIKLRSGRTKSCGCIRIERNYVHGLSRHKLNRRWSKMKSRCYNENQIGYENYGGRGITMCDEWKNDFIAFYNWAIKNGYKEELYIDRIDNNGNYEPGNCRWATRKQQMRNTRINKLVTYNGETKTIIEWSEITGIPYDRLQNRITHANWTIEKALTTK